MTDSQAQQKAYGLWGDAARTYSLRRNTGPTKQYIWRAVYKERPAGFGDDIRGEGTTWDRAFADLYAKHPEIGV